MRPYLKGPKRYSGKDLRHRLIREKLGRLPHRSMRAMLDYGLNDDEIGQYFRVTPSSVRRLRHALTL